MDTHLIQPHGGQLVNLLADAERADELKALSRDWASWNLTPRQVCDLELLITGAFSPLTGFLGRADYQSVCETMRLADGALWPIPVMLDVSEDVAGGLAPDDRLALRDAEGYILAVLTVGDVWQADLGAEAEKVYGTTAPEHPGVACLNENTNTWYVGGSIEALAAPKHYDFVSSRLTPAEVRQEIARRGWRSVAGVAGGRGTGASRDAGCARCLGLVVASWPASTRADTRPAGGRGWSSKLTRTSPTVIRSPSASASSLILTPLTDVPCSDPRSRTSHRPRRYPTSQ